VAFLLTIGLLYLWYLPWPDWTFSRFLLPALPLLFLMALTGIQRLAPSSLLPVVATIVIVLGWEMHFIQTSEVRNTRVALSRFEALGQHLRSDPPDGAVLTRIHSGSLRYYASATTVRWDQITSAELRQGIESELAAGRHPLLIDDSDDRKDFEGRFGPVACWGDTSAPLLTMSRHAEIRVLSAKPGCAQATS
jgi:hypothetical protein